MRAVRGIAFAALSTLTALGLLALPLVEDAGRAVRNNSVMGVNCLVSASAERQRCVLRTVLDHLRRRW